MGCKASPHTMAPLAVATSSGAATSPLTRPLTHPLTHPLTRPPVLVRGWRERRRVSDATGRMKFVWIK